MVISYALHSSSCFDLRRNNEHFFRWLNEPLNDALRDIVERCGRPVLIA